MGYSELLQRLQDFAQRENLTLLERLGFGSQGIVFAARKQGEDSRFAIIDRPAEFSEEVMADWRAEKQEQFGVHWHEVQAILREFESYGIFLEDVKPDNISVPGY